jgi:hypothetical protein
VPFRWLYLCYGAYFRYQVPGQEVNGGGQHDIPGDGRKSDLIAIWRAILPDLRDTGVATGSTPAGQALPGRWPAPVRLLVLAA